MDRRLKSLVAALLLGGMVSPSLTWANTSTDRDKEAPDARTPAVFENQFGEELDFFAGRRAEAKRNLDIAPEVLEQNLADPDERVRRVAVEVLGLRGDESAWKLLLARLIEEPSSSLRSRIATLLGRSKHDVIGRVRKELSTQTVTPKVRRALDDYLRAKVTVRMEELTLDRTVPGFYDGQFDRLFEVDENIFEWLSELAQDPSLNFVVRVLAIMSLPTGKNPKIDKVLVPLIQDPRRELDFDMNIRMRPDEAYIKRKRRYDISRYARYSLAKAGYSFYIDEMISVMEGVFQKYEDALDAVKGSEEIPLELDLLLRLVFEIGYYHQQIDRYESSMVWYKKLIEGWPNAMSANNAHYNIACIYAIQGDKENALAHLQICVDKGFADFRWMMEDGDLKILRDDPRFLKLVGLVEEADKKAKEEGKGKDQEEPRIGGKKG